MLRWAGALGPLVLYGLHGLVLWPWINDDAGISFAYARNLASGHGLVSQPGMTPVEGFSNPLWVFLLTPPFLVHAFDPLWTPKILSFLLVAATFLILSHALRGSWPSDPWFGPVVCGLLALQPAFVIWTVSGLENPLTAALAVSLLDASLLSVRGEAPATAVPALGGVLAGALALARPDGVLYAAAFPLIVLACRVARGTMWRRPIVVYGLAFLAGYGPYVVFRLLYFGDLVPNTYHAKGGPTGAMIRSTLLLYPDTLARLRDLVASVVGWQLAGLAILGAVGACGVVLARSPRPVDAFALMLFTGIAVSVFLLLPPDYMREFRFATAFYPFVYSLGLMCVLHVSRLAFPAPAARVALAAAIVGAGVGTLGQAAHRSPHFASAPTVPFAQVASTIGIGYNHAAEALGVTAGSLLAPDLGGTLYYSKLRVYDLGMLCDRVIARTLRKDTPRFHDYVFEVIKPTFIHTHGVWATAAAFDEDPRFRRDYVPIRERADAQMSEGKSTYSGDYVRREVAEGREDRLARAREILASASRRPAQ